MEMIEALILISGFLFVIMSMQILMDYFTGEGE